MTRAEAWEVARGLVVRERATYEEASAATGLPVSTIQKRVASERWQLDRETAASYAATIKALKQGLLDKAMEAVRAGGDPAQLVYAWKVAEAAYPEHRYNETKLDPRTRLAFAAELLDLLVVYLAENDRVALAKLEPHLMEITKRFEAKSAG